MTEYERLLLSINSANLAANLENVSINEKILAFNKERREEQIVKLLKEILEEVRKLDR